MFDKHALLHLENVTVARTSQTIVRDVDLAIGRKHIHALVGANGSGKSTLAQALMGSAGFEVVRGRILLDGHDITRLGIMERARLGLTLAPESYAARLLDESLSGGERKRIELAGVRAHLRVSPDVILAEQYRDEVIGACGAIRGEADPTLTALMGQQPLWLDIAALTGITAFFAVVALWLHHVSRRRGL